jgi:hypothetical protein
MKRVVNGVTYNVHTSTRVATSQWEEDDDGPKANVTVEQELYQTRGGAFFLLTRRSWCEYNADDRTWDPDERIEITPINRERAQGWLLNGQVEIIDTSIFGEPPEAIAEDKPAATIYLRLPTSLKNRIETRAKAEGLSVNSWAMRCMERCLAIEPSDSAHG